MKPLLFTSADENDNFHFERVLSARGFSRVCGTDEVGRGPLAGPVVAACVILPPDRDPSPFIDSKKTTEKQRYQLQQLLLSYKAEIGIGIISPQIIDQINIHQASLLAMKQSITSLSARNVMPDYILVDGKFDVPLDTLQQHLIKGDEKSASIAAASIVAKIVRDEIMTRLHAAYPHYGFLTNKGYPTRQHRDRIKKYGICPAHRLSFRGVKEFVQTKT
ncbi:MAG: ribonuclease HII [Proteobacteria bacterium]|nr:MAG: ribonuclease HII [Pseudomonadota bacterium]